MSRKKTLFDHYLDAIQLIARADVHLEFYEKEMEGKPSAEVIANLRADIAEFLRKKAPSA
jgi:hypothetical protein